MGGLDALGDLLGAVWAALTGPAFGFAVRLAIGGLFVVAGAHKLWRPAPTAQSMRFFGLGPVAGNGWARALGALEVALGLGLVLSGTARLSAAGCVVLAAGFTFLTGRAYRRGERFACGCLSSSTQPIGRLTVIRSGVLLAGALLVAGTPGAALTTVDYLAAVTIACGLIGVPLAAVTLWRCRELSRKFEARVDWDGLAVNWAAR